LRNLRFRGNGTPSGGCATSYACRFGSGPDPVVQHVVECEPDGMLNRTGRRAGCAGANDLVGVGEERGYWKSRGIGCSVPLGRQVIRSCVGPKSVRGIGPGTVLVNPLPHLVKSRVVSAACLQVDQNVPVSARAAGAFYRSICWNRASGEVGLIFGGCNGYVRLIVRNFNGGYPIRKGSIRIVPEEWFHGRRQIGTVHRSCGGSIYGQAGGGCVHPMVKDGSWRKDIGEESVVAVDGDADVLSALCGGRVRNHKFGRVGALTADQ